ncbi:hypothetical protein GW17_00023626 [Ensete ventricosum]|nr:hypothetical protein GW17_00023626 [Ensete ventricosum]
MVDMRNSSMNPVHNIIRYMCRFGKYLRTIWGRITSQRRTPATLKAKIGGVSLQRSIVWILLERRTFDLLHLLHPDLEYKDIRSP